MGQLARLLAVLDPTYCTAYGMSVDVAEVTEQVRRLCEEWHAQRRIAETATRQAAALSRIILGYVSMFPELDQLAKEFAVAIPDSEGAPRGAEAARQVLHDSPDEWFLVSELVDRLRSRGWLPDSENPANAVRTALERLVALEDSDIKKSRMNGKVAYSYRPDDAPPTPAPGYAFDEEPF